MKRRLQLFILIIFVVLVGISCNAPRTNPLDPLNPDYNYGTIEGTVLTIGIPSYGISDVKVLWENANLITETDANGRFRLSNIPIKDGNIVFSKTGYKPDTLTVQWGSSKRYISLTFLNRIPTLDTVSIYTIIKYDFFPLQTSELFVKAWITDLDRDVDSVFIFNETLNLKKPLTYLSTDRTYESSITKSELNVDDIEETIGLDFSIITKDRPTNDTIPGSEFIIGEDRITRVIKDEVIELIPSGDSIVTSQPVIFNWNEFEAGYDFTYLIEVFSNTFPNSQLVHTKTNIPSDSSSYSLSQNLPSGRYFWVIWIIDQFQNRSRSKPVNFRIQ